MDKYKINFNNLRETLKNFSGNAIPAKAVIFLPLKIFCSLFILNSDLIIGI